MSCLWKCFTIKEPLPNIRIPVTLNLDEVPETLLELRAYEMALIDQLVSIHYQIEDTKSKISHMVDIHSEEAKYLLRKRMVLTEKRKVQEKRLQKIREKLKEVRGS